MTTNGSDGVPEVSVEEDLILALHDAIKRRFGWCNHRVKVRGQVELDEMCHLVMHDVMPVIITKTVPILLHAMADVQEEEDRTMIHLLADEFGHAVTFGHEGDHR